MKENTNSVQADCKDKTFSFKLRLKKRSRRCRQLESRIHHRNERIAGLEAEVSRLQAIVEPQQVFNCVYPAQMMALAIFIVLHGGSLRCAAATAGFYAELMGWSFSAPSFKTVSNWVKRCGLHALNLTQSLNGEFVGIVDGSIQIGKEQLMLLLGVPVELINNLDRPLRIEDVEILGMEVQKSWKGQQVSDFIDKCLQLCPTLSLKYLVCDQGTNLMAGLGQLALPVVNDCSHIMMNLVKKIFKDDLQLSQLCAAIGKLRQQLTLTDKSFLLPPSLRDKDRFLRIFTVVDWIDRIDSYSIAGKLKEQLCQMRSYWLDLRLRQVRYLVAMSARLLKHQGLSKHSRDQWIDEVMTFANQQPQVTTAAKTFIEGMSAYLNTTIEQHSEVHKLLCCSDIIESIFGRYKNKGGMKAISSDVLAIALYKQPLTPQFVQIAMKKLTGPQVNQWAKKNVCENRYGLRKRMETELKNARQL